MFLSPPMIMLKKEKPMMSVTAIIQGAQAQQHWRGLITPEEKLTLPRVWPRWDDGWRNGTRLYCLSMTENLPGEIIGGR
uniref:Uncharacterized protein n=1 Tax=Timema cristinae TaxID=61476 RepID=A0A7R9CWI7_TIMCR|nr:unnamed protein product [Timema cristinae]